MAHETPHLAPVPAELADMVRDCVRRRGTVAAAKLYGISRHTLASVLAGLPCTRGTTAILRLAFQRREAA